jgi:lysyl-tRNA synthetase class 2
MSDFRPTATLPMLRRRAALLTLVRAFFTQRGFLEVDTPLVSHDVVVDRHLDPLPVTLFADPRQPQQGPRLWLQTSPEFHMKRLLAAYGSCPAASEHAARHFEKADAGSAQPLAAIFQVTRAFRGGERGRWHNPEFTIVEWYRVGDDYHAAMDLLDRLAQELLAAAPAERLTYRDALLRYADVDPLADSNERLAARAAAAIGADPGRTNDRDGLLDLLLTQLVEPQLGRTRPTILCDYPPSQAALARVRPGDPPVAERFELYVQGVELANGYHELLDPQVLRERNRANNAQRTADGKYPVPEESRLLAAMEHGLPPCAGCALGFDRLLMVLTGACSIEEVLPFPIEQA